MSGKAAMTLVKGGSRDVASPSRSFATRNRITLQRAAIAPTVEPGAEFKVRETLRSSGQPLDAQTRSTMEPRFGFDFSDVRVHADTQAAESAKAVGAHAYAAGSDVVFGDGKYAPSTAAGQQTLSHELTHVVQQASGPVEGTPVSDGMTVSHPGDRSEQAAAHVSKSNEGLDLASVSKKDASGNSLLKVQRLTEAQAPNSTDVSQATTGIVSGAGGILFGILGSVYAAESAHAGRRQAAANEDPPVGEPVTGGVVSGHVDAIAEAKGLEAASDTTETTTTSKTDTKEKSTTDKKGKKTVETPASTSTETKIQTRDGDKGPDADVSDVTKTTTKNKDGADVTATRTVKPGAKATTGKENKDTVVKLLEVRDGKANDASFMLRLRKNGHDIKGGATEDGDILGYMGGSSESNLNVNFKQYAADPLDDGTATVRLGFAGNNTPPRMKLHLSDNNPAERVPGYTPQRFAGSVTFDAAGNVVGNAAEIEKSIKVNPIGTKKVNASPTAENPVVLIDTARQDDSSGPKPVPNVAANTPKAAPGTPQPPKTT
jgi:hypothetical protein